MKKKKLILMIVILLIVLVALVVLLVTYAGKKPDAGGTSAPTTIGSTTAQPTTPVTTTVQPTTPATQPTTVPPTTVPVTVPPTTVPPTTAAPTLPPPTVAPTTAAPTLPPPKAQPDQILAQLEQELDGLAGNFDDVDSVDDPQKLTLSVSDQLEAEDAARDLLEQIKEALGYDPAKADPNVAVGNPDPFTYAYKITHVETADGKHTFRLEYRFVSANYTVTAKGYDTNQLTAAIRTHLESLGKTWFDSHTAAAGKSQPVIVLLDRDYDTVLSTVKAQVESTSGKYTEFDFYYAGLTFSIKDGLQQEAMLFYLCNR